MPTDVLCKVIVTAVCLAELRAVTTH